MHEFYTKNYKILLNKWTATCIIIDWKTQRCKDVSFHHCHVSHISQGCECKDFSPFYPCELFFLRLSCEFMRLRWTNLRERLVEKPESPLPFDSGSIVSQLCAWPVCPWGWGWVILSQVSLPLCKIWGSLSRSLCHRSVRTQSWPNRATSNAGLLLLLAAVQEFKKF